MEMKINWEDIFSHSHIHETQESLTSSFQESESESAPATHCFQTTLFGEASPSLHRRQTGQNPTQTHNQSVVSGESGCAYNPGERMYYDSIVAVERKKRQVEHIKSEEAMQLSQQATFRPKINRNTQKILGKKAKVNQSSKREGKELKPLYIRKEEEEIRQCTFKPQLVAKSHQVKKLKDAVFEALYRQSNVKELKSRVKASDAEEHMRKHSHKKKNLRDFQGFLQRNAEFMHKVKKKNDLITSTSKKFDLETGDLLFTPKTSSWKGQANYRRHVDEAKRVAAIHGNTSLFTKNLKGIDDGDAGISKFCKTELRSNSNEYEVRGTSVNDGHRKHTQNQSLEQPSPDSGKDDQESIGMEFTAEEAHEANC